MSVAVREIIAGTSDPQAIVISAGACGTTGAIVSSTSISCEITDVLPQASVKVQVLVITYEFGQSPGATLSTPKAVIEPEQLSIAVKDIGAGTSELQKTSNFTGGDGGTGAMLSSTVIV